MRDNEKLRERKKEAEQTLAKLKEKEAQLRRSVREKQRNQRAHLLVQMGLALEYHLKVVTDWTPFDQEYFVTLSFPLSEKRQSYLKALALLHQGRRLDFLQNIPEAYQSEILERERTHRQRKKATLADEDFP